MTDVGYSALKSRFRSGVLGAEETVHRGGRGCEGGEGELVEVRLRVRRG